MAMPPGNAPPGFPGTHQPNQPNQLNQPNQPNQLSQANQINPTNQLAQQNLLNQANQLSQSTQPAQPMHINQSVSISQTNPLNQPNQQNQQNPQNTINQQFENFFQMARNSASTSNLAQLNHTQQQQPQAPTLQTQPHHPQVKQERNIPASSVPPTSAASNATLAAFLNPANIPPALTSLFKKLAKSLSNPQGPNSNPLNANALSLLRLHQLQNQTQQANFQQRSKQNLQHIHLPQMQTPNGSISTSASTPTLSALSSVSSAPGIIQQQNQTILASRQPASSSKKQKEFPKADVAVVSQSLTNCIESCGLSSSFLERVDKFEVANNAKINPKALSTIAMALYLRMHQIVEQSVKNCHIRLSSKIYMEERQDLIEKQKRLNNTGNETSQQKQAQFQLNQKMNQEFQQRALTLLPGEPVFTDIPMANIALIETERRIINSGINISQQNPKPADNTFNIYRNQVLCGIAARAPEQMREKITGLTMEIPDNVQPDLPTIARLGLVQTKKKLQVSFEDVYQVIENDIMFTPEKLLSSKFSFQARQIDNLQARRERNDNDVE